MIRPDNLSDETLEYVAQLIEALDLSEYAGILSRRKRDREDAQLRIKTSERVRRQTAAHIRAMKERRDLDARAVLGLLADLNPEMDHAIYLVDAWPLAWEGWLDIHATLNCNTNCVPPPVSYRITLTERGLAILAESYLPPRQTAGGAS